MAYHSHEWQVSHFYTHHLEDEGDCSTYPHYLVEAQLQVLAGTKTQRREGKVRKEWDKPLIRTNQENMESFGEWEEGGV